jgi:hypothetical protein
MANTLWDWLSPRREAATFPTEVNASGNLVTDNKRRSMSLWQISLASLKGN